MWASSRSIGGSSSGTVPGSAAPDASARAARRRRMASRSSAAPRYFWYSMSWRTSSARGSADSASGASPGAASSPGARAGASARLLISTSVAAITRNSPARSTSTVSICRRNSRYCSVSRWMGMSLMSTSCRRTR